MEKIPSTNSNAPKNSTKTATDALRILIHSRIDSFIEKPDILQPVFELARFGFRTAPRVKFFF
jgi:hypothetical protein